MGSGKIALPSIMLAGRLLSALFGIGSVLLLYISGRKLTGSVAVGIVAAAVLAVSPIHIASSQKIAPDALVVFFVLLAFYGAVGIFVEGKLGFYILSGIGVGLAASSKYNGALIMVAPMVAHFFRYGRESLKRRELYICLGLGAATFFATTPFSVLDYRLFIEEMTFEARHYASGHAGFEGDTIRWYTSFLLTTHGPLLPLALAGFLWGVYRRSRSILLIAAFPIIYFIFINRFTVRNPQTILLSFHFYRF
jgi:4-amino-4-deoxy-L-arabinose transferase-like glycosyltransferase